MSLLTGRKTGRKSAYFFKMFFFFTAAWVKVCLTTSRCDELLAMFFFFIAALVKVCLTTSRCDELLANC